MKSRPILFSAPMVRANLEGRKTQTRRVVKPQPRPGPVPGLVACYEGDWVWRRSHHSFTISSKPNGPDDIAEDCPYGIVGDLLWVRETLELDVDNGWVYAADGSPLQVDPKNSEIAVEWSETRPAMKSHYPSIHMPRWASRLTLRVLSVRVERLHDISEEDAKAEGVAWTSGGSLAVPLFEALWKKINGPESWDANPWVWVVGYERVKAGA